MLEHVVAYSCWERRSDYTWGVLGGRGVGERARGLEEWGMMKRQPVVRRRLFLWALVGYRLGGSRSRRMAQSGTGMGPHR